MCNSCNCSLTLILRRNSGFSIHVDSSILISVIMSQISMDVVVVGSCMTDLVSYVPRLPQCGETLHGNRFVTGFGGKGANQCITAARLGARTAMVAKLGKDTFGENYLQNFKDNDVNVDHVSFTAEASTGVAPISVANNGDNSIVIVSGANLKLTTDDVDKADEMISSAAVVVCQLEIESSTTLHALQLARKHNVKTILNAAPVSTAQDLTLQHYTSTDILCVNEVEAGLLMGAQAVSNVDQAKTAAASLLAGGCGQAVIITMGDKGAVLAERQSTVDRESDQSVKIEHIPVQPVCDVVDTTGAGDSFVGALSFFLARNPSLSLSEMIRRSNEIAAVSVRGPGTQTSFPYRKDLPNELFN